MYQIIIIIYLVVLLTRVGGGEGNEFKENEKKETATH